MKPFPIPVVPVGPGSQGDESPDYLAMPKGMETFTAPRLPENVAPDVMEAASRILAEHVHRMAEAGFDATIPARTDLFGVPAPVRDVITQSLGFGEVSAFTVAPLQWRIQETAFAGLWRVLALDEAGRVVGDLLEGSAIPAVLGECMRETAAEVLPPPAYPPGVMNAEALVEEIRQQAAHWQPGGAAHVINLTLLPVSEADLDTLYGWLGHREVSILSRGYGNCRITSTRLKNVWWVQYFNSMDALILNTLEITTMPEVALASADDYADSVERLGEYLEFMVEPA